VARERTVEEVAEELEKLWHELQRLADRFDTAPFVRTDLHNEQIRSLNKGLVDARAEFDKGLASVARLQMWILGVLGSVLIAAVVAVITAIAQGGLG
jgi:hypothetical protein